MATFQSSTNGIYNLILNKATSVTNGSYHPFEETGAAVWTIESTTGTEYISGISLIPGDLTTSYT
jgi:hypothetical protein